MLVGSVVGAEGCDCVASYIIRSDVLIQAERGQTKTGFPASGPPLLIADALIIECTNGCQSFIKDAVSGNYNNPFFGDAKNDEGYKKRVRAVVQYLN